MEIGLNSLYNIGTNYSIKLTEKEALVVEDAPLGENKSSDEKILVQNLQSRDVEVRAHEAADQGADGRMYAIGGEVSISIASGSTPQETIRNAQQAKEMLQEMLGKETYKESGAKSDEESKSKTKSIDTPA